MWSNLAYLSGIGLLSHDPLTFDPFAEVNIYSRVKQIARQAKPEADEGKDGSRRTGTPPAENWLALLDGAARWVLDYSGPIVTICKLARERQIYYSSLKLRNGHEKTARFRKDVQAIINKHLPATAPAPRFSSLNGNAPGGPGRTARTVCPG